MKLDYKPMTKIKRPKFAFIRRSNGCVKRNSFKIETFGGQSYGIVFGLVASKGDMMIDNIFIAGLGAIALLAVLIWTNFRRRQKLMRQQNELQTKIIKELEKDRQILTIESMLKGQEVERARLAKDVHDGLGSMLASVKHILTSIKPTTMTVQEMLPKFEKSLSLLDTSIEELRRIAHSMMPESVIRFGLSDSLRDFCQNLSNEKLRVKYMSFGMNERFEISKEVVTYRIVQELINNSVKHAQATQILVQLSRNENIVIISVEDNGLGFDVETLQTSKGFGWRSIEDRARYLNGKITLTSNQGKGTFITVEFYV